MGIRHCFSFAFPFFQTGKAPSQLLRMTGGQIIQSQMTKCPKCQFLSGNNDLLNGEGSPSSEMHLYSHAVLTLERLPQVPLMCSAMCVCVCVSPAVRCSDLSAIAYIHPRHGEQPRQLGLGATSVHGRTAPFVELTAGQ